MGQERQNAHVGPASRQRETIDECIRGPRSGRSMNCCCVHRRVTMYTRPGTIRRAIDIPFRRQVASDGAREINLGMFSPPSSKSGGNSRAPGPGHATLAF